MSNKFNSVDFDFLVTFCKTNLPARVLMNIFSHRRKNTWKPTTIEALQRLPKDVGYNFSEPEILKCCKAFKKANCGNFIPLNEGGKSQFQWQFQWQCSSIEVAKEVMKRLNA